MAKQIFQETMCCGYKKCPEIVVNDDGSIEISDNDPEIGSVGNVKFRPEQTQRLLEILLTKVE